MTSQSDHWIFAFAKWIVTTVLLITAIVEARTPCASVKWIVTTALFLAAIVEAKTPYARCFQRFQRHVVDNAQPLAELFYISPHECLEQCILTAKNSIVTGFSKANGICKSAVYNHFQHNCRLYDHSAPDSNGATLRSTAGFDFYERTATTQECAGPLQRFFATAKKFPIEPSPPSPSLPPFVARVKARGTKTSTVDFDLDVDVDEMSISRRDRYTARQLVTPKLVRASLSLKKGEIKKSANTTRKEISRVVDVNIPTKTRSAITTMLVGCQSAYYTLKSHELMPSSFATSKLVLNVSVADCAEQCVHEMFLCASFVYDKTRNECLLLNEIAEPDGHGRLASRNSAIYAERFCLPAHRQVVHCASNAFFEMFGGRRLHGGKIVAVRNLTTCLQSCLNQQGCRAVSYDSARRRCHLHDSRVDAFQPADPSWILVHNDCQ